MTSTIRALIVAGGVLLPTAALAHPMGNLGISHHSDLRISAERIELRYTLDYAEIPTFQEMQKNRLEPSRNERVLDDYLHRLGGQLSSGLRLSLNRKDVALQRTAPCQATFLDGVAGMHTMRVSCVFAAALPTKETVFALEFQDFNYKQRSGWKEIILNAAADVIVQNQSVPLQDRSAMLTQYPSDALNAPPQVLQAVATFKKRPAPSR